MNYETARKTLTQFALQAFSSKPSVTLIWETEPSIDLDRAGTSFVRAGITFDSAMQLTVNNMPSYKGIGTLAFTVFVREVVGIKPFTEMLDFVTDRFRFQKLGGLGDLGDLYTDQVVPGRMESRDGWRTLTIAVPFKFFSS